MSGFDTAAILIAVAALAGYLNHRVLRLPHTSVDATRVAALPRQRIGAAALPFRSALARTHLLLKCVRDRG
jgi:hypothetical protein